MNDAQAKGRRTLILIALIFSLPIVGAMYMYFSGTSIPISSTVKGNLISPPKPMSEEAFTKLWSLLVLTGDQCDQTCLDSLVSIRQIRLSLGPKMPRVQTVYLPAANTAINPKLAPQFPKLIVVPPERSVITREEIGTFTNGEIFLVDPLGNLMMSYPAGTEMGDIRKDMAHLLKLSGIG
ncbi:MAG: hypothetical protein ACR2QG_11710 [Gammaproteobacteria bacterium]